ncbi:PRD domain-containing protein [Weizmannia acidilactici]|uniref:PRD domain-containing protein n=1 Tax=Weizmannia acidilactici TaxID=2607726 RepID=UPI0020A4B966|nr:PRD domain-containing protein [Weizmannia acidilactici]
MAAHITIACKRIKEGFVIETLEHGLSGKYPFEKMVAEEIVYEVEKLTGLEFPESEIDYIIIHLLGTKLIHKDNLDHYYKGKGIANCTFFPGIRKMWYPYV